MLLALITTLSYASAAVVNTLLLLLLLTSWRGRLQGSLLLGAVLLTIISSTAGALHAYTGGLTLASVLGLDALRLGAWALFIVRLLYIRATAADTASGWLRLAIPATLTVYALISGLLFWQPGQWLPQDEAPMPGAMLLGAILLIWLIEQLIRNSSAPDRWAIKYLCMGVGATVIFDAVLFIDALLFNQINPHTWAARGLVQAIATPLIAISATRNPDWDVKVFVSRGVVFFTSSLMATGGYLLLVAAAGYFLKVFGGDWGETLLATLLFTALLGLIILLGSAQLRGQLKQFITRNFYRNKYEYREEWLKLTKKLAAADVVSPYDVALTAMRELLESPAGALWSANHNGQWQQTCQWEWPVCNDPLELNDFLIDQFQARENIINLTLTRHASTMGTGSPEQWPTVLTEGKQPWLLIPLNSHGKLEAIIQIGQSHSLPSELDWEDIALVTAASHQVAAYLAFHRATEELAEARQFEAYNRLSAFMVHDLKNVIAQLKMVGQNAEKHADNPEFIADAFATIDNAVIKMNSMLMQLRDRHTPGTSIHSDSIDLANVLDQVVKQRSSTLPIPSLRSNEEVKLLVRCDPERMTNVLLHLVQNAQEATDNAGEVTITTTADASGGHIEIADTGSGMDASFIKNQLFRPFKTTKGNAGMGIGVYESKDYIESLGGRITVSSEPNVGTRFQITLPLLTASEAGAITGQ